jgi:MoaA/NifB/PqqE/SkfB family radical SAM enzyme
MTEAKELGIYFIAVSGGEPFMWPHLVELCRKHNDMAFMIYTNGTLIDETMAEQMRQAGNMSPAISIEGDREATDDRRGKGVFDKIMLAMDHLRAKGVIFGASCTVTRNNIDSLFSDEFMNLLIEKGALYVWSFHYIPIGSHPDFDMMITPEQRENLVHRVRYLRSHKPIQIADFWNDGHIVGGCIAGGRRYIHIDAAGWAEPCAFVHFANVNFKGKSLKEVLQSPIFNAYQKRQPFNRNMLCPCPIIDNPTMLREIVAESAATPTHHGAETILKGELAANLDELATEWGEKAEALAEVDQGAAVK